MRRPVIAVDGPAGAGKSTVARRVARALGFRYIDTGAMYRAVALKALTTGVDLRSEAAVRQVAAETEVDLTSGPGGETRVWLDGVDVTEALRGPEVNASVSVVAGFPSVRALLVERQRRLAADGGVVMDGRDIGTVVLPYADYKFFLTASLEARTHRRQRELSQMGFAVDAGALREEIRQRDALDQNRAVAPLRRAEDAVVIDTTDLSVDAVVDRILSLVTARES
ncbi:MAG: (d)CMP kinase [Actinomycetia bacterium]|nr:(d)CMP kinase [Actinomycetes bacterium]